jgi:anti-anti-sigma regulatory factor
MSSMRIQPLEIKIERAAGEHAATVMHVAGVLNGDTYRQLIDSAQAIVQGGEQRLVVDLHNVPALSSAGLVALHQIANLLERRPVAEPDAGWEAIHAIARQRNEPHHRRLKLRSPRPAIQHLLHQTGMMEFMEIEAGPEEALSTF